MRPPSLCFAPQFGWSSVAAILPASRRTVGCPADLYASPRLTCSARSADGAGIARFVTARRWARDITGARTTAVIADYLMLWDALQGVELQPGINDRFIWR
jgi:hypothetical protein